MDFQEWSALFQSSKGMVEEISQGLCAGSENPSAADVFTELCNYGRSNFVYTTSDMGFGSALASGTLSCRTSADLTVGVILCRTGISGSATVHSPHGGNDPIVTPPITNAGIGIFNNLRGGGNRMLFTGGHSCASVDGTLYDLVSGLSGTIDYLLATKGAADAKGKPTYKCTIDGAERTFTGIGGTTGNGLAEFKVDPPLG
jgi:hypothetical protein